MTGEISEFGSGRPRYAELAWRKESKRARYRAHSWFAGDQVVWTIYDRSQKKGIPESKRYHAYTSRSGTRYEKQFSCLVAAQTWCSKTYLGWRLGEFQLRTVQTRLSDAQLREAESVFAYLSENEISIPLPRVVELWRESHATLNRKSLRAAIQQFVEAAAVANLRPRTRRERKNILERFLAVVGDVEVHTIKLPTVEDFINGASGGIVPSPTTRRNRRAVLHKFWEWMSGKAKRYCLSNVVADYEKPVSDNRAVEVLSLDEAERLFSAASGISSGLLVPYVALALFAGMRDEELGRLSWADLDLESGQLTVHGRTAKTRAARRHKLSKNLVEILKSYRHFPIKPKNFPKLWRKVREDAGFNCSKTKSPAKRQWVEDLTRHSAISYWLKIEQDEARAAYRFGNSPNVIHAHYEASVSEDDARRYFEIGLTRGLDVPDPQGGNLINASA